MECPLTSSEAGVLSFEMTHSKSRVKKPFTLMSLGWGAQALQKETGPMAPFYQLGLEFALEGVREEPP